jgi:Zn-finger nucleic acid-binding protein
MTERLGRYLLLKTLAAGGMGEIFVAEHTGIAGFAKRVALKRIRPELSRDRNYVQLFLNEARLGSFLNHPNIVHIFDVGHEGDDLWLVMEYVDGVDLRRLARRAQLAGHPLRPEVVAAIGVEVLTALAEAHSGGPGHGAPIVHRDLSPENVLIATSGAVKVLDFGLAKWVPESRRVPSLEGNMIFGKVRYMPPEQLRGQLIDPRADLFALGVLLYEVLAGDLPFGRGSANQVLGRILAGPPPSPTARQHVRDPELDAVIARAMAPDPDRRWPTAETMRDALLDHLRSHGGAMPLESLRRTMRRGAALGVPLELAEEHGAVPEDRGLSVAERCGKCGGPFHALLVEGLFVDRCRGCHGTWLDEAEIERLLGAGLDATAPAGPGAAFARAPLDRLAGSCPSCRIALTAHEVPGHPAHVEVCPRCRGTWFDRGELELLGDAQVMAWLRGVVRATPA